MKENPKRLSGNSLSPLGDHNRNLGASSQTSLTGVKLCLRRRLHVGPLFPGFKCLHVVYHFYSFLTWPAATPSKQFSARWALPGSVRGLARRNKIATDDTVVVPCKKITTIRAVTARVTLTTFKDVAPKKWELFVTQLMFLSRGRQTTLPPKIFIFNSNNRKNVAWISSDYFESLLLRRKRLKASGWNSGYEKMRLL